jgi:hypothetical protein
MTLESLNKYCDKIKKIRGNQWSNEILGIYLETQMIALMPPDYHDLYVLDKKKMQFVVSNKGLNYQI